jgi:CRP/FNR family transcriptional regulator, cyclic AMP receptor protein
MTIFLLPDGYHIIRPARCRFLQSDIITSKHIPPNKKMIVKTILLIEDNEIMRENTAEILELSNYKVMSAENGKLGIELAAKNSPDLIICDIAMPEMDGLEVLKELSAIKGIKDIPFIFLTALSEKSQINNGLSLGANEYVTKPYMGEELLKVVAKYLGAA